MIIGRPRSRATVRAGRRTTGYITPDHKPSQRDDWQTPPELFDRLNQEFGPFTLDPAAAVTWAPGLPTNAMVDNFYVQSQDGLVQSWAGHRVFLNPPYGSALPAWMAKTYRESRHARTVAVGVLPARTDPRWFHDWIKGRARVDFLPGRIRFVGAQHSAPFPSMVVVWGLDTLGLGDVKRY